MNNPIMRSLPKKRQSLKRLCLFGLRPGVSRVKGPGIRDCIIYVSIAFALIITAGTYIFDSASERAGIAKTKETAMKSYRQYSQKLDAISKKYANELNKPKKVN